MALNAIYDQEKRYYHGNRHIYHCLEKLEEARDYQPTDATDDQNHSHQTENSVDKSSGGLNGHETGISAHQYTLMELALWFHDAVYIPGRLDNEMRSAELFRETATGHLEEHSIAEICDLIVATEHSNNPTGYLEQLMVDIDLSGFALDRKEFLMNSCRLRQEFDAISDKEFIRLQTRFLTMLRNRKSIYLTPYFRARYETRARENISHLLETYNSGFLPEPE